MDLGALAFGGRAFGQFLAFDIEVVPCGLELLMEVFFSFFLLAMMMKGKQIRIMSELSCMDSICFS